MTSLMTHITAHTALDPAFGTYALPPQREAIRRFARHFKSGKRGQWMISFLRKLALRGAKPPIDVEIEPGLKARLYPTGNRCEKRAVAGVQIWDLGERHFMRAAIQTAQAPFIFLDIGANIGLYSLYAGYYAVQSGRAVQIHAVEPDRENQRRLMDNVRANGFDVTLWPAAVSDSAGQLSLTPHNDNRGEIKLSTTAQEDSETVTVITLDAMIKQSGFPHIDLLKLDIEGHDLRALRRLFENCNQALYPKRLIIETGTPDDLALMTLCYNQGYVVKGRGRLNMMLERDS
jgi:FkbM family methyltransferase